MAVMAVSSASSCIRTEPMGRLAMAKKTTRRKPMLKTIERPAIAVTLRGSGEWKSWLEAGARFCRTDVAKLIDAALVDYLRARGFKKEAPDR